MKRSLQIYSRFFLGEEIDFVRTLRDKAGGNRPYFPAKTRIIHRSFEDPAAVSGDEETRLRAFRKIRDEIKIYFENDFVKTLETE